MVVSEEEEEEEEKEVVLEDASECRPETDHLNSR